MNGHIQVCLHPEDEEGTETPKHILTCRGTSTWDSASLNADSSHLLLDKLTQTQLDICHQTLEQPWAFANLLRKAACGFAQHSSRVTWTRIDIGHQTWAASPPSKVVDEASGRGGTTLSEKVGFVLTAQWPNRVGIGMFVFRSLLCPLWLTWPSPFLILS